MQYFLQDESRIGVSALGNPRQKVGVVALSKDWRWGVSMRGENVEVEKAMGVGLTF